MSFEGTKISPKKYRAYTCGETNVFAVMGVDGGLSSKFVAYLYYGKPTIFDGSSLGVTKQLRGDKRMGWMVYTLPFTANDFIEGKVPQMVAEAEAEMDTYLNGVVNV